MMSAGASEYGGALYALAKEEKLQDEFMQNLKLICDVFTENKQYVNLLQNPSLKKEERLKLLSECFEKGVHKHVLNFCKILCEKSALNILPDCKKIYTELFYEDEGILPVQAISAVALSDAQKQSLANKLREITGKKIELATKTDATLLSGIKLVYSGKEVDGSVLGRLENMQALLAH